MTFYVGTWRQLDTLYKCIKTIHSKIKFTIELEKCNKLNVFDIEILKTC